ncbi:Cytochrome P450 family 71 protein [Rhynchospora pubera]|uniref:Cytochrome P450 family 71 protein n=1 Tax=Rhynchospora pubera TaxID=906938 RepID=A0AAV8DMK5_9POAL|nr:Cytochrome P450 family 71 protein [Rhynchospora pubera]
MELTFPSLLYQLSALLLFVLALKLLHKNKDTKTQPKLNLPPGPRTLPFIGNLHYLVSGELPHRALHNLARSHGPVMLLRTGQTDLVVITSKDAAQEVMKAQDANFSNRPVLAAAIMAKYGCIDIAFSNGPYWRQLRRICVNELLSSRQVKSLSSIRRDEVHSMLKWLSSYSDKSPVKLAAKVSEVANNIVACAAFGGRCRKQGAFLKAMKDATEQVSWFCISDIFPSLSWLDLMMKRKLERMYRVVDPILEEIVQEHLQKQRQQKNARDENIEYDLADLLIKAMDNKDLEEPLTFDSVKAVIIDMFSGGTDTTTTTIEWAMTELIKHPNVMAKVQAEIRHAANEKIKFDENDLVNLNYLKLVIKETLRLHPPVPLLLPRQCKETCQLLGYSIPAGARVVINAWALGRDPNCWNNADEFIPERFEGSSVDFKGNNFEFVPFGAGRRSCPGMEFGMAVIEVALARLLLHFDWKLPDGVTPSEVDMMEQFGAVCHKKNRLSLIPILRFPLPDV